MNADDAKKIVRVVTDPRNLEEAQEMILSASGYMDKLQKEVSPPARYVGLKIAAGAAATFGGFVWLAGHLTRLRWTNQYEMHRLVHQVLDERERGVRPDGGPGR